MILGHLELFVEDVQRSRDFYVNVLEGTVTSVQGEGRYVWLEVGGREILLRPGKPPPGGDTYRDGRIGLVLYTDDLPRTVARLEERGARFGDGDGGPDCPTLTDPDGNWIQVVDPRNP